MTEWAKDKLTVSESMDFVSDVAVMCHLDRSCWSALRRISPLTSERSKSPKFRCSSAHVCTCAPDRAPHRFEYQNLDGDASITMIRTKKKYLFDFSFKLSWKVACSPAPCVCVCSIYEPLRQPSH